MEAVSFSLEVDHMMDLEGLKRRMAALLDDELQQIVGPDRDTYRPEAVELAEAELHDRGIVPGAGSPAASGVEVETIDLEAFRSGLAGTQYRELVQHHVRRQSLQQLEMGVIGTVEMLPPALRPALETAVDEWNETARYEMLWESSTVEVFDRMLETARILLFGVGIEPTDHHLFNICQVFILTHAVGASESRELRKFAGIKKGIFG